MEANNENDNRAKRQHVNVVSTNVKVQLIGASTLMRYQCEIAYQCYLL